MNLNFNQNPGRKAEQATSELYAELERLGITRPQIARELGISRQALGYQINHTQKASLERLIQLQEIAEKLAGVRFDPPTFIKRSE